MMIMMSTYWTRFSRLPLIVSRKNTDTILPAVSFAQISRQLSTSRSQQQKTEQQPSQSTTANNKNNITAIAAAAAADASSVLVDIPRNNSFDIHWQQNFERLRTFIEKHCRDINTNSNSSSSTTDDNKIPNIVPPLPPSLRQWIANQRYLHRRTLQNHRTRILSPHRQQLLEALNEPYYSLFPRDDFWNKRLQQLKEFLRAHNQQFPYEFDVSDLATSEEQRLWHWCNKQRQHYKIYQRNLQTQDEQYTTMTSKRMQKLDKIGFVWDQHQANWEQNYQQLQIFYQQHLHTLVPEDYEPNKALGRWVSDQRRNYKLYLQNDRKSTMTLERIELLNALEFSWDAQESRWLAKYKELQEFLKMNMKLPTVTQHAALYEWCRRQQLQWRKKQEGLASPMTDEREALLRKVGFPWSA